MSSRCQLLCHIFRLCSDQFPVSIHVIAARRRVRHDIRWWRPPDDDKLGAVCTKEPIVAASLVCRTWHQVILEDPQLRLRYLDREILMTGADSALNDNYDLYIFVLRGRTDHLSLSIPRLGPVFDHYGHRLIALKLEVLVQHIEEINELLRCCKCLKRLRHFSFMAIGQSPPVGEASEIDCPLNSCLQTISIYAPPNVVQLMMPRVSMLDLTIMEFNLKPPRELTFNLLKHLSWTPNLQSLALTYKRETYTVALEETACLPHLKVMNIEGGSATYIHDFLLHLSAQNLEYLTIILWDNTFTLDEIAGQDIIEAPSLRKLSISFQARRQTWLSSRFRAPKLQFLSLGCNFRSSLETLIIHSVPSLTTVDFMGTSFNLKTCIHALNDSHSIENLYLRYEHASASSSASLPFHPSCLANVLKLDLTAWWDRKEEAINEVMNVLPNLRYLTLRADFRLMRYDFLFRSDVLHNLESLTYASYNDDYDPKSNKEEFGHLTSVPTRLLAFLQHRKETSRPLRSMVFRGRLKESSKHLFERWVEVQVVMPNKG